MHANPARTLGGLLTLSMLALCAGNAEAQVSKGGTPLDATLRSLGEAPVHTLGFIDLASYIAEDALAGKDEGWRFGAPMDVDLGVEVSGEWRAVEGGRVWRQTIQSPGALSLNCRFDQFHLPPGARLFVYNEDRSMTIGAFTWENNKPNGQFAIQPVAGESITLELFEPTKYEGASLLHIHSVIHDYRGALQYLDDSRSFGDSGSCNNDVACSVSAGWEDQIRSVGMLLSGGFRYCTGAMINNTAEDGRQLFLSANHCSPGASDIVMFNYESPSCNGGDGPTGQTAQGLSLLANGSSSDFWIVEVQEAIPASYSVYLSGFDATGSTPSSTVGIHHPSGDVKKISFDNDAPAISGYFGGGSTHWNILNWEDGTTEGGSSGSPLFHGTSKRIIGQLHGGTASCSSISDDYYGRVSVSWGAGLSGVLDPGGLGTTVDGMELGDGSGVEPPENNACADALPLSLGDTAFNTSTATQTVSTSCASGGSADLWYSWTAPSSGSFEINTCSDESYDTALALYDGCGGSEIACNDDDCGLRSRIVYEVSGGSTYLVRVGGYSTATGPGILTAAFTPDGGGGPDNDLCGDALPLGLGDTNFDTSTATQTVSTSCASGGSADLWYSWTAPSNGSFEVNTCSDTSYDTALALYDGCGGSEVACNDNDCGTSSRITYSVTGGSTYIVRVGGSGAAVGSGVLTAAFTPDGGGDDNDTCAGALPLSLGDTPFDTGAATQTVSTSCAAGGSADLWYSWTAPSNGSFEVNTCGDTSYDTALALYDGCGGSEIACNDDDCSLRSRIVYAVTGGSTYIVRVGGYSSNTGPGLLTALFTPDGGGSGPANDNCADAIVVSEGDTAFDNTDATTDGPDEPGACTAFSYSQVDSDIWYSYTPAQSGDATISLCGSGYDTKLAVYEGGCPGVESAVACNDDACSLQSEVTLAVTGGTQYLVRIGGYNGAQGAGTMNISLESGCPDDTPLAPQNLEITLGVGNIVTLSWEHVTETVGGCPIDPIGRLYHITKRDAQGNLLPETITTNNTYNLGENDPDTVRSYNVYVEVLDVTRSAASNTVCDPDLTRFKQVEGVELKRLDQ